MLSKSTEYAIRALVYIQLQNWNKKRPGVIEIANEIESPTAFTAKILHTLSSRNLLLSMKGRGGGFFYDHNQSELKLYDVIVLMEGDELFHKCGFGLKDCNNNNPCPIHSDFIEIRDRLFEVVNNETINSLAEKIRSGQAVLNRIIPN